MKKLWLFGVVAIAGIIGWTLSGPEKKATNNVRASQSALPELPSHVADVHFDYDPPCRKYAPIGCMVFITGDSFIMGAQNRDPDKPHYDPDADDHEAPPHEVEMESFWIHKEEVKTTQFEKCVNMGGCSLEGVVTEGGYYNWGQKDRGEHPMNGVSWHAANTYCKWLGGRLPTEAEWEFAARSSDGRRYPWGDALPNCQTVKLSRDDCGIDGTSARPAYLGRSEFAVEDMAGSLWEWSHDWYGEDAYEKSAKHSPEGPETGTRRSIRGGGWMDEELSDLRCSVRAALDPNISMNDLGFRCVRPHGD